MFEVATRRPEQAAEVLVDLRLPLHLFNDRLGIHQQTRQRSQQKAKRPCERRAIGDQRFGIDSDVPPGGVARLKPLGEVTADSCSAQGIEHSLAVARAEIALGNPVAVGAILNRFADAAMMAATLGFVRASPAPLRAAAVRPPFWGASSGGVSPVGGDSVVGDVAMGLLELRRSGRREMQGFHQQASRRAARGARPPEKATFGSPPDALRNGRRKSAETCSAANRRNPGRRRPGLRFPRPRGRLRSSRSLRLRPRRTRRP